MRHNGTVDGLGVTVRCDRSTSVLVLTTHRASHFSDFQMRAHALLSCFPHYGNLRHGPVRRRIRSEQQNRSDHWRTRHRLQLPELPGRTRRGPRRCRAFRALFPLRTFAHNSRLPAAAAVARGDDGLRFAGTDRNGACPPFRLHRQTPRAIGAALQRIEESAQGESVPGHRDARARQPRHDRPAPSSAKAQETSGPSRRHSTRRSSHWPTGWTATPPPDPAGTGSHRPAKARQQPPRAGRPCRKARVIKRNVQKLVVARDFPQRRVGEVAEAHRPFPELAFRNHVLGPG